MRQIVGEQPACLLGGARRRDHAFLPGRSDREGVARRKRPRRKEYDATAHLLDDARVLSRCVLRAGIEGDLSERYVCRKTDDRLRHVDREGPAGAGGVPVKLVEVLEEPDLARAAVGDDVFVRAATEDTIRAADADADAVAQPFGDVSFRGTVAGDGTDLEIDDDTATVASPIRSGEIAQDSPADFPAFGLNANGLGDVELSIAFDLHVAAKQQNTLLRRGQGGQRHQQEQREKGLSQQHRFQPCEMATLGTAASERSSSSKNGASLKPSGRDTSVFGNDWMAMLRSRTAPL
jgi:hypothetical protein